MKYLNEINDLQRKSIQMSLGAHSDGRETKIREIIQNKIP